MNKPNFFIVGAPRCGTTAIYHFLNSHPDVYMSKEKETNYFLFRDKSIESGGLDNYQKSLYKRATKTDKSYEELFKKTSEFRIRGEASPLYLYTPWVPKSIYNYNSNAKILAILRQPIERAYSHFKKDFSDFEGNKLEKFLDVIEDEEVSKDEFYSLGNHYLRIGLYYKQVKRYFKVFGEESVKLILYEDFKDEPNKVLKDVCGFLGIDKEFDFRADYKVNPSGTPKSELADKILTGMKSLKRVVKSISPSIVVNKLVHLQSTLFKMNLQKDELEREMVNLLTEKYFSSDIKKLKKISDLNYGQWKFNNS